MHSPCGAFLMSSRLRKSPLVWPKSSQDCASILDFLFPPFFSQVPGQQRGLQVLPGYSCFLFPFVLHRHAPPTLPCLRSTSLVLLIGSLCLLLGGPKLIHEQLCKCGISVSHDEYSERGSHDDKQIQKRREGGVVEDART